MKRIASALLKRGFKVKEIGVCSIKPEVENESSLPFGYLIYESMNNITVIRIYLDNKDYTVVDQKSFESLYNKEPTQTY